MSKRKSKGHPSGWYTSRKGNTFHALAAGRDGMSQETLDAIANIADAVHKMYEMVCPVCGNTYGKGLTNESDPAGAYFICECGWNDRKVQDA